jgi:nucleoside-diphosphate-sugar epimerase
MTIVILGGSGFFGRNLVRVMAEEGVSLEKVTVIDKDSNWMEYIRRWPVKTIVAELSEHSDWEHELMDADIVVNCTAQISSMNSQDFVRNNVQSARVLVEALKKEKSKAKIIHISSAAVLSVRKDDYANTKKEQEEIIVNSGFRVFSIRPSLMYGPTDTKNIGYLINFARKIPLFPIPGSGKFVRQPIYIDDVCRIVIGVMRKFPAKNEVISVNGNKQLYYRDMIKSVLRQLGGLRFRVFLPVWLFKFLMVSFQTVTRNKQFTTDQVDSLTSGDVFPDYPWWDEFHIKPTEFEEGVRRMIEFDKAQKK